MKTNILMSGITCFFLFTTCSFCENGQSNKYLFGLVNLDEVKAFDKSDSLNGKHCLTYKKNEKVTILGQKLDSLGGHWLKIGKRAENIYPEENKGECYVIERAVCPSTPNAVEGAIAAGDLQRAKMHFRNIDENENIPLPEKSKYLPKIIKLETLNSSQKEKIVNGVYWQLNNLVFVTKNDSVIKKIPFNYISEEQILFKNLSAFDLDYSQKPKQFGNSDTVYVQIHSKKSPDTKYVFYNNQGELLYTIQENGFSEMVIPPNGSYIIFSHYDPENGVNNVSLYSREGKMKKKINLNGDFYIRFSPNNDTFTIFTQGLATVYDKNGDNIR